jgi:hypothetical protein
LPFLTIADTTPSSRHGLRSSSAEPLQARLV